MLKTIDKFEGYVIQKVTKPTGELVRYQAVIPGDAAACIERKTLQEVREYIGRKPKAPEIHTLPKMACPHNQPGYRADSARKSK